ncbi:MAG: hypothetical protein N2447_09165, partial [Thermoanaerobaculum sp.]|nr:hypothetical protein [Thermoanaerobaculum sp.]
MDRRAKKGQRKWRRGLLSFALLASGLPALGWLLDGSQGSFRVAAAEATRRPRRVLRPQPVVV